MYMHLKNFTIKSISTTFTNRMLLDKTHKLDSIIKCIITDVNYSICTVKQKCLSKFKHIYIPVLNSSNMYYYYLNKTIQNCISH